MMHLKKNSGSKIFQCKKNWIKNFGLKKIGPQNFGSEKIKGKKGKIKEKKIESKDNFGYKMFLSKKIRV